MPDIQTRCDIHGDVRVPASIIVIDDEAQVYRLICPEGGHPLAKRFTGEIRKVLRGGGVRTIEEVVDSEKVVLEVDEQIWKSVES